MSRHARRMSLPALSSLLVLALTAYGVLLAVTLGGAS